MRRKHLTLCGLALAGLGLASLHAQDGVWKPVREHTARYEAVDLAGKPLSLIGRPITGRSKVDQSVEPASFGTDTRTAAPLPAPPSNNPAFYAGAVYPKGTVVYPQGTVPMQTTTMPGMNPGTAPIPAIPNGTVTYPMGETITAMPQAGGAPVIVNGQVVGDPVYGNPYVGPGFVEGDSLGGMGALSDRYFLSAIHGSPGIWYGSFEFSLYSLSADTSPPLVITGPQNTVDINSPGVTVLNGGTLSNDSLVGGKATMGVWFNRCQTWGMFGSFFTTATNKHTFSAASADGSTFLARPFFNVSPVDFFGNPRTPGEDLELVAAAGLLGGRVDVERTQLLRGAELNFRFNLLNGSSRSGRTFWNIDSYFGAKYMGFDESLTITEDLTVLTTVPGGVAAGDKFFVQDQFMTRNNFFGGNIGLISEARLGRFFVDTHSSLAMGVNSQEVAINGNTRITRNNVTSPLLTGGLLAQMTNIGNYQKSQFSLVPEFGVKLGLQVSDHFRIFAGYDLTYWTNVVRPGQQIDYSVNLTQQPRLDANGNPVNPPLNGPARPAFNYQTSNLWISGFSAGISWIF